MSKFILTIILTDGMVDEEYGYYWDLNVKVQNILFESNDKLREYRTLNENNVILSPPHFRGNTNLDNLNTLFATYTINDINENTKEVVAHEYCFKRTIKYIVSEVSLEEGFNTTNSLNVKPL